MQVGDWVLCRPHDEPNSDGWVVGQITEMDDSDIPFRLFVPTLKTHTKMVWRRAHRVRLPASDAEWAAVIAARLTEGAIS